MKRRKLYYVPGLISIIGLPILLLLMGPEDRVWEYSLRLNLLTDEKDVPGVVRFSRDHFFKSIKNKKIVTVALDYDWYGDGRDYYIFDAKLHFITREVERLQFTHDTMTILEAQLGDDNTYGDFIRLINHARAYRMKRYVYIDNSFYFMGDDPPPAPHPTEAMEPLNIDSLQIFPMPKVHVPTKWELFKRWGRENLDIAVIVVKYSSVLVIGFVLLIVVPAFFGIRKAFFKKNKYFGNSHVYQDI